MGVVCKIVRQLSSVASTTESSNMLKALPWCVPPPIILGRYQAIRKEECVDTHAVPATRLPSRYTTALFCWYGGVCWSMSLAHRCHTPVHHCGAWPDRTANPQSATHLSIQMCGRPLASEKSVLGLLPLRHRKTQSWNQRQSPFWCQRPRLCRPIMANHSIEKKRVQHNNVEVVRGLATITVKLTFRNQNTQNTRDSSGTGMRLQMQLALFG